MTAVDGWNFFKPVRIPNVVNCRCGSRTYRRCEEGLPPLWTPLDVTRIEKTMLPNDQSDRLQTYIAPIALNGTRRSTQHFFVYHRISIVKYLSHRPNREVSQKYLSTAFRSEVFLRKHCAGYLCNTWYVGTPRRAWSRSKKNDII